MEKVALLIGVSEYEPGLAPLPGAVKDISAMQRVLQQAEIGGFTQVESLPNPDPVAMQVAIETLFSGRNRDDLVLLFFSGHGIKDEDGRLYFATRSTRKAVNGELRKATAVPASFVHDMMSKCRSKRQVVILDCCFSGAFTEGLSAKDDGSIDVKAQLGGEGRVVLTSSSSIQYSFEQQGYDLSIYTHYLVEGMETGAADRDNDGFVSIDELHTYASGKVHEAVPAMQPGRHVVRQDGEKILLTKALIGDLKLRYRKEVEKFASRGEISPIGRSALEKLQIKLNILPEDAIVIEDEILKPYREYQHNLQQYRQMLAEALQREGTLSKYTRIELKEFQNILGLRDEDIQPVVKQVTELREASPQKQVELDSIASIPQSFVSPSDMQPSPHPNAASTSTNTQISPLLTKPPTQRLRMKVILAVATLAAIGTAAGLLLIISKKQTLIDQVCNTGIVSTSKTLQDTVDLQVSVTKAKNSFDALEVIPFLNDKFTACNQQANSTIAANQKLINARELATPASIYLADYRKPKSQQEPQKLTTEKLEKALSSLNKAVLLLDEAFKESLSGSAIKLEVKNKSKQYIGFLGELKEASKKFSDDFAVEQLAKAELTDIKQFFNNEYLKINWQKTDRAKNIRNVQKKADDKLKKLREISNQGGSIEPLAKDYEQIMKRVSLAFWIEETNLLEISERLTSSNFSDGSDRGILTNLDQWLQTFQLSSKSQKILVGNQMSAAIISLKGVLAQYDNAIDLAELCSRSSRSIQCLEEGDIIYVPFKAVQLYNVTVTPQKVRFSSNDVVEAVNRSDVLEALSKQMKLEIEKAQKQIKASFAEG